MVGDAVIDRLVGREWVRVKKAPFRLAVVVSDSCGQRLEADDVRAAIRGNPPQPAAPRWSNLSPRFWNIISYDPEKVAESLIRLSRGY
jgi:hypothetical protein